MPANFIDFVALMLLNMAAGLALLAGYVAFGLTRPDQRSWVPGFAVVGMVALITGTYMIATWPLPGPYNSAFGEMSIMLGIAFLGAALALAKGWSLVTVGVYGAFGGAAAMVIGFRIMNLKLTAAPMLSGVGFILTGLFGGLVLLALLLPRWRVIRALVSLGLLASLLIWAATAYMAYWGHMKFFQTWKAG
jgi:putative membrane protein